MRILRLIGSAGTIVLWVTPSLAHADTICRTVGIETRCTEERGHQPLDFARIMSEAQDLVPKYEPRPRPTEAEQAEIEGNRQTAELRKRVGAEIREGRCPEAIDLALSEGDLRLASEVKAFCAK